MAPLLLHPPFLHPRQTLQINYSISSREQLKILLSITYHEFTTSLQSKQLNISFLMMSIKRKILVCPIWLLFKIPD